MSGGRPDRVRPLHEWPTRDTGQMEVIMENRVLTHAAEVQRIIDSGHKPDGSPLGDIVALESSLDLDLAEVFAWQTAQSSAHALGLISTPEAQTVHLAIGGGGWADGTSLALKVTITNLMGQLLPLLKKESI